MKSDDKLFDVCVIGGGLAGLTAAISLARAGFNVGLIAPLSKQKDHRSTALLAQSVELLKQMEIWPELEEHAFPLKVMRIVDGTNRLFRAPQTEFHASEIDLPAFGYNVANSRLLAALEKRVIAETAIKRFNCMAGAIESGKTNVKIMLAPEPGRKTVAVSARFVIGADGRESAVRKAWSIGERRWSYPQSALVLNFEHTVSSHFISTEFHTRHGPFTIVPHSHNKAGLVWVETPQRANELANLPKQDLARAIERKMQSFLGKIKIASPVQCFELSGMIAKRFGVKNCALVGEAAHVFPPIGAQGLNLGIRDVACITQILQQASEFSNAGDSYHQARRLDVQSRTAGVDLLNRSLLSNFIPAQFLRSAGLFALANIGFIRRYAMQAGIAPAAQNN